MRTNDFYDLIELVKREVLGSETEYLKLLKVIGNNQRYDFLSQLSIYDRKPKAVACASFDMWRERFHRTVMRGEKGIPILYESEGKQKIAYVFDIGQTVSIDRNVNEVELWSFDKEKDTDTLKEMIRLEGYTPHDSLLENLYFLSRIYADQDIYELANNLRVPAEDRNSFVHFMRESISYALSGRFHVEYPIDMEKGKENFLSLDSLSLMFVGNCISNTCNRILEATIERTKKLSLSHGLTKNRSAEYNKNNPEEVRLETERDGEAEQGGMGDAIRSNDERDDDRGEGVFSDGEYGRNSEDNQEENFRQSGRGDELYGGISEPDLCRNETGVSGRESERDELSNAARAIQGEEASQSLNGSAEESNPIYERRKASNDEGAEYSGRGGSEVPDHDFSIERDGDKGSGRGLAPASNFKIRQEIFPDRLTPSERLNYNMEAISMLNRVEKGERVLDESAQEVLARYVGWGGLSEVFDEERAGQW